MRSFPLFLYCACIEYTEVLMLRKGLVAPMHSARRSVNEVMVTEIADVR